MTTSKHYLRFETLRGEPHVMLNSSRCQWRSFATICMHHNFCLASVCRTLGVTTSLMRDSFMEYAGMSPKKWMIQYRVLLAVRALREGKTMIEVIDDLGYHDQPHMGKDFKAILGEAPRTVRARLLRNQQVLV